MGVGTEGRRGGETEEAGEGEPLGERDVAEGDGAEGGGRCGMAGLGGA